MPDLGLDRENPSAALDPPADGAELCVDLGYAGDRAFRNNVSFGSYAALVQDPADREDKIGTMVRILLEFLARPGRRHPPRRPPGCEAGRYNMV
ncbi:hypothetical protein GCM10017776_18340 [Streptomyces griseoluteus]|nr:hypothetical protein GCM10017776_18340 [Streptomyces griseoluteus]